ncbi:hypothetical protein CMU70_14780 [Elizabethkingia anophelis]|nr:hypothetical protein [Elizabethkingia anophelis]
MKLNFYLLLITAFCSLQCEDKPTGQDLKNQIIQNYKNQKNQIQIKGDSVIIPDIRLIVYLSEDAVQKLQQNKETVIASLLLYVSIDDEDIFPEEIRKEIGPDGLKLGNFEIREEKISNAINFNFKKIMISKKLYNILSNKDISVNINVFSGRKHFKDNILNVESYDSKLSKTILNDNIIKLNGHLIVDSIETKQY